MDLRLIFWETTKACNLGCSHCRASAVENRTPLELDTNEAKKFIDQVASFSNPILVFSGGEPLLREDIYELAQYATNTGLKTALATNATLISEDVADKLKDCGLKIIAVSIYGSSVYSHDKFCGKIGAFEETLKGIENIKKAGIDFQINTTVTKQNSDELESIGKFAVNQGASAYHVFFLVPTGRGKSMEGDKLSPVEYESVFNRLYDLELNLPIRIKATCAPQYYRVIKQRSMKDGIKKKGSSNAEGQGCLAGQSVCFVSHTGEVFGCGYLPVTAGDLRKEDFKSIWSKSTLFNTLRDHSKLQGRCGVCEFKDICGGCRARAYAATSDYLEEEPECSYQPLTVKY